MIKPKTTVNSKNEFNVIIEKRDGIAVADMSLFRKQIKEQAEEEILRALRE